MRPCAGNRDPLALLASGALPVTDSDALQRHLETCPTCRAYLAEVAAICDRHQQASRALPDAEVPDRVLARVTSVIKSAERHPASGSTPWIGWSWVAFASAVVLVSVLAVRGPSVKRPATSHAQTTTAQGATRGPEMARGTAREAGSPRMMTYRLALNRSSDEFERLLGEDTSRWSSTPTLRFRPGMASIGPDF